MLGFTYVVLTAKPVSIRRLCLLYVFLLASARCLLSVLHIEDAGSLALGIATAISFFAWVSPLVRIVVGSVLDRRIALEAFESVSACVRFTYGFVLVLLPVIALETWHGASHASVQATLIPAIAWASVGGASFVMMIQAFKGTTRAKALREIILNAQRSS